MRKSNLEYDEMLCHARILELNIFVILIVELDIYT